MITAAQTWNPDGVVTVIGAIVAGLNLLLLTWMHFRVEAHAKGRRDLLRALVKRPPASEPPRRRK